MFKPVNNRSNYNLYNQKEQDLKSEIEEEQITPDKNYQLGNYYAKIKNEQNAIKHFERAAMQGHGQSAKLLGEIYEGKHWSSRFIDINKSLKFYEIAANQGDTNIAQRLAFIFRENIKFKDIHKAIRYLELTNQKESFHELGRLYWEGNEVPQDIELAKSYFIKANARRELDSIEFVLQLMDSVSKQKDPLKAYQLGKLYLEETPQCVIKRDIKKAIEYLEIASQGGHPKATFKLARIYRYGCSELKPDPLKSMPYFEKAQSLGYPGAATELGLLYLKGSTINQLPDLKTAVYLFEVDAQSNHDRAHMELGRIYRDGKEDFPHDLSKAMLHFQIASDKENIEGMLELGRLYQKGNEKGEIDLKKAIHLYEKAAYNSLLNLRNNPFSLAAAFELGCIHLNGGEGIEKNHHSAMKYFKDVACDSSTSYPQTMHLKAYASRQMGLILSNEMNSLSQKVAQMHFERAIKWKSSEAVFDALRLGKKYHNGEGVEKDPSLALKYFEIAAKGGNIEALVEVCKKMLADFKKISENDEEERACRPLYLGGRNVRAAASKPFSWHALREWLDLGIQQSEHFVETGFDSFEAHAIADAYFHGLGGPVDKTKGIRYLTDSSNKGSEDAMMDLISHYRDKKSLDEVQEWENRYRTLVYGKLSPKISELGGTLLVLANNVSSVAAKFLRYHPHSINDYRKKLSDMRSFLRKHGILSKNPVDVTEKSEGGMCSGMVIDFFHRLNHLPEGDFEAQLIQMARHFEHHSGIRGAALHTWYLYFFNKANNSKLNRRNYDFNSMQSLYRIQEQKIIPIRELEKQLNYNDNDYINGLLSLPREGNFHLVLKTGSGYHAIALIKRKKQIYLWDPNNGLITCPIENAQKTLLGYLSNYYSGIENHQLYTNQVVCI